MQFIVAAFWNVFLSLISSIVGRAVAALGMAAVTYTGVSATLTFLKTQAVSSFQALPPFVYGLLSTMRLGTCISMIFSAIVIRATLNGLSGDKVKRFEVKK